MFDWKEGYMDLQMTFDKLGLNQNTASSEQFKAISAAIKPLNDSPCLTSTVLLTIVWFSWSVTAHDAATPAVNPKQVNSCAILVTAVVRYVCLVQYDVAVSTWPFQAEQQFVSLCGESMERHQAVFSPLVATWEKTKGLDCKGNKCPHTSADLHRKSLYCQSK